MIKPKPLQQGDSVAIIAPASPVDKTLIDKCVGSLKDLGLEVVVGTSCLSEHGFLSGTDDIRANDINRMFADKNIKGIFAIRGGYGCARLLDLIDFKIIKKNPKIFVGYSDITALHIAINQKSKLITYHGPMVSTELIKGLDEYSADYYKRFLFSKEKINEIFNPVGCNLEIINDGIASGQLIGGNLSLVCSSLGTKYEINTKNKILFLEEVDETPYKVDRMLLQLKQSGKFKDATGIILGAFTDCIASSNKKSLSLEEVFNEIILPLKKPTISKLVCGHCLPTLTLPLGSKVILDANEKRIKIIE
ncbi:MULTISPECIES: LD-carboxypeptidase [unclassified Clostridium]|uniref:S66 peptidase family protein n=1 Tax=Clostridium TaxID=1485 RepID=UPI001C8BDA90|nr:MULTISPECIES: LD-carboxypeptidase [unclassified Clostridium]MBX9136159.1 LD-carboxypeptidase [Clostridium sp. K12(2020)]MBX9143209.1 LD-carboxypeptidase [Clostridium sp. K13]MDU2292114.1 LD-carboxypeptidase [Clostridium celatum]MDU4327335.1 LD-carboxypeptidase [Clostridium celatum]